MCYASAGGSHDYWGGPGYDACRARIGPDFEDVFYKNNWAANVKMHSVYMFYGYVSSLLHPSVSPSTPIYLYLIASGTNWGGINYPGAYTSYDYAAAIKETRVLWAKHDEMKRQALFLRSSPQFRKTDWVGDTQAGPAAIPGVTITSTTSNDNSDTFATYLRNPDSGTGFLIARHTNSSALDSIAFRVALPSSQGTLDLPQTFDAITLDGRQSKVITTDYTFGRTGRVQHTTAAIFFAGVIGARDVLFLTGDVGHTHEVALGLSGRGGRRASDPHISYSTPNSNAQGQEGTTTTTVTVGAGLARGLVTLWDSDAQLVLFADPVTAASFWAPAIRSRSPTVDTVPGLESFWQFGTNETVLVGGPYLVRNATIEGGTLALHGDLNASVPLTVVGPKEIDRVTWNGVQVDVESDGRGVLRGELRLGDVVRRVRVPKLGGWRYMDSLPEVKKGFDDEGWVVADHTETNITQGMLFGDGRVLYGEFGLLCRCGD